MPPGRTEPAYQPYPPIPYGPPPAQGYQAQLSPQPTNGYNLNNNPLQSAPPPPQGDPARPVAMPAPAYYGPPPSQGSQAQGIPLPPTYPTTVTRTWEDGSTSQVPIDSSRSEGIQAGIGARQQPWPSGHGLGDEWSTYPWLHPANYRMGGADRIWLWRLLQQANARNTGGTEQMPTQPLPVPTWDTTSGYLGAESARVHQRPPATALPATAPPSYHGPPPSQGAQYQGTPAYTAPPPSGADMGMGPGAGADPLGDALYGPRAISNRAKPPHEAIASAYWRWRRDRERLWNDEQGTAPPLPTTGPWMDVSEREAYRRAQRNRATEVDPAALPHLMNPLGRDWLLDHVPTASLRPPPPPLPLPPSGPSYLRLEFDPQMGVGIRYGPPGPVPQSNQRDTSFDNIWRAVDWFVDRASRGQPPPATAPPASNYTVMRGWPPIPMQIPPYFLPDEDGIGPVVPA